MFEQVREPDLIHGEHEMLHLWKTRRVFDRLREKNAQKPPWSFIDGPITANNPMGVHHAWGRTYKDAFQRFFAMTGHSLRYQNGFDCQGLWVEVEVERELGLPTKDAIREFGIDRFVQECKKRVLKFAARQTEQSVRLGYWMDWDDPAELRRLADSMGSEEPVTIRTPRGESVTDRADRLTARLGNPEWGGSYFTFSTENNETIWTFLKKCFERGKIYRGHDVMPWSGRGGSAYSQMEVAEGRKLTVHRSVFVRFPLRGRDSEYLLIWTTTPWTLTSNVAAAVNPDLEYVKLRAKRDGAVYYFAKDNLEYQRLAREHKEGFGRPEWQWPADVPKLKSLAQIFREQGGYDIETTLRGAEMVGWEYDGPFDDLPAQQADGGLPEDEQRTGRTGVSCHRVIDGGRDARGNANVVAGEGTGIVHIAPGCGDVDSRLGREHDLVAIAPLGEDGRFVEGFGDFTGREAVDPATADHVFSRLKDNHLLVSVEQYPHIYPHCWRTGDELVFRLVDEWFINMDWREEIKDVTRQIRWLPDSISGQEREIEWLSLMSDWMISKKRFWGLALPVWVDEETGDFEVIGSLAELQERAVEGWDDFQGNTPHRPWIDQVKIRNEKTGNLMHRVEDVGNPWLDAGIVPFSTMHYNTNHEEWQKWYPADLVTECFPGQFRNWFYSLLSMATMMDGTPPFRTLLGHRLVMNEHGQPMHKSDGTAIWFEEAAEQLGVDTMRWMYLAQNPASDLRFGLRHPDDHVTLETPDGPASETAEGAPMCRVTSKPSDDVRRQVLIPLWNSYAFFVNYARADGFDARLEPVADNERTEIDRWILSRLQEVVRNATAAWQEFDSPSVCRELSGLIDDLSSWYIRRNRRRFWRSGGGEGETAGTAGEANGNSGHITADRDKLAAYQTLYQVLTTLSKLIAPALPFLAERMYQNLVVTGLADADGNLPEGIPDSVHLCDYPVCDEDLLVPELNHRAAVAQRVVRLGHRLREEANQNSSDNLRVRQPLGELRVACDDPAETEAVRKLADTVAEELNVKQIGFTDSLDDLVNYTAKPNLPSLGPKYGKLLGKIRQQLPRVDQATLARLRSGETITLDIDGTSVELGPDDVLLGVEQAADWMCGDDGGIHLALSTQLTPELRREGTARDVVRRIQQLRKDSGLDIQDRILIRCSTSDEPVRQAIEEWSDYIRGETLADELQLTTDPLPGIDSAGVGDGQAAFAIATVAGSTGA